MADTFTPALGRFAPTWLYDRALSLTRERLWRALTLMYVAPRPNDVIVDVGCGTGSLALLLHRVEPGAHVVGVDPDPQVLEIARRKARLAGVSITWRHGRGDAVGQLLGPASADTVVSSLVLHQCPMAVKRGILASMFDVVRPGGRVVLADYGWQRTAPMRAAFRTVQLADGRTDTRPNADGALPALIAAAGFLDTREVEVVATMTGSISVYVARRSR